MSPGLTRRLIVLAIFTALIIAGLATTAVSYRQRVQLFRGWRDATTTPDLLPRLPLPGVNVDLTQYDSAILTQQLDRIAAAGFVWLRQPFRWSDIEPKEGQPDFTRYDALVQAAAAHPTLKLIAVLDESPEWARHVGAEGSRFAPPASPSRFAEFVGQLAAHYKDTIHYFQVWDEPNLNLHWGGLDPQPADYVALLRAAYSAIHGAAPDSTVIAAALAPTTETGPRNLSDVDFLHAMYANGAAPYFDAAAAKPYGFDNGPLDRTVSADVLNFSRIILLREEMERQHDGAKALWGSNFGWNSLPPTWKGAPSIWGQVNAAAQAQYTRTAYQRAATEWPWIGGLILEHWQPAAPADDPIQGFAIADKVKDWSLSSLFSGLAPTGGLGVGLHAATDPAVQYSGAWRFGALGADVQQNADATDSRFSLTFSGSSAALSVRRDNYVAYLYLTIDGQPANALPRSDSANGSEGYLLLTSPDRQPHIDLITVARNLPPGDHQLQVRAYLGNDHWAIAGIAIGSAPDTRGPDALIASGALLVLIGAVGVIGFGRSVRLPGMQSVMLGYFRQMRGVALTVGVSLVTMLGMALTWGGALPTLFANEPPTLLLTALTAGLIYFSPAFIVTALSIVALFVIVYNRPSLGLALVVFWTPFFLFPVQLYLLAVPMVEVSVVVTALALALRSLTTPRPAMLASPAIPLAKRLRSLRALDYAMLALVAVATLSLLWSEQRAPALRELRTMILEPAAFYAMLRLTPLTQRDVLRLVDTLLIAGVLICLIGLGQYFHILGSGGIVTAEQGSERLASVYGSPNNVALFLGRCIPFALALALFHTSPPRRIAAAGITGVMLIAALLTQSVGGLLIGIPAACVVVLLAWNVRRGALITAGAGLLGALSLLVLPRFVPRLQGVLSVTRESSVVRTLLWQSTVNLLRERPLTGAGLDQFLYLYRSRYILPDAYKEPDLSHPHNFVLDYWVSLGIAGLAILVALQGAFWLTIFGAYRRARRGDPLLAALCAGAMGSMADFLAHGLVDNSYFVVDLAYVFCLTAGLAVWLARAAEDAGAA